MVEQDTIKLLKECDAGVKMGVDALDSVSDKVNSPELYKIIDKSTKEHQTLGSETHELLNSYGDAGKSPNPMAKSMSHAKTAVKMSMDSSDATVADLLTDGCNMGIKSLSRYLNQYAAADEKSKNIAKRLIKLEENLSTELRGFL